MIAFSADEVKIHARGRWLELLQVLGGLRADQLNGKNQPCPKCGGKDRYAAFKDVAETGGVNCRHCHDKSNGDGFATLCWLTGKTFGAVLVEVANHCGIRPQGCLPAKRRGGTLGTIVATYDYRDEKGGLLFQAVRYEPKDFRQRAPKAGGGWVHTLAGVRLVPYRLPELLAAKPDDWVLVVEGEKDADNLRSLGFVATCNPMGALKWRDEFSELLRGRKVAILPDNDEKGGQHGALVAASLMRCGCKVRIVPVRIGKDASDWIAGGATWESIQASIQTAADCEPGGGQDDDPESEERAAVTTIADEMRAAIERECSGSAALTPTGLADLDRSIEGGFAFGEIVLVAARPSHGKSAVGLQFIHHWTQLGIPCAFCSEEMTNEMVGVRALQFATARSRSTWARCREEINSDIATFVEDRASAFVIRKTCDVDAMLTLAAGLVNSQGVRCVVVDYAQQLAEHGKRQYEGVTEVSKKLAAFARRENVILVALCQLSRAIESRDDFVPRNSDLKESGQLEQDADVILHLVWPWMLDNSKPKEKYVVFVGKNRNRGIMSRVVTLNFEAARQRVVAEPAKSKPSYVPEFDQFNDEGVPSD